MYLNTAYDFIYCIPFILGFTALIIEIAIIAADISRSFHGKSFYLRHICFGICLLIFLACEKAGAELMYYGMQEVWSESVLVIKFILSTAFMAVAIYDVVCVYRKIKNSLSENDVKNAIDHLSQGILIYDKDGRTVMVNDAMDGISRKISGNFVKNGCEFKNVIADMNNIFDDGESIWHFDEKRIETSSGEKLYQINAVNVTTEIKLSSEIMEDNERLRELNEKLKEYSRDIDHTVKEEELLGAKVKIHDEFGRVLLLARAVLSGNEETIKTDELIRNWKNTVALFGSGAMSSDRNSDNPVSGIMDAANFLGVEIEFKGDISDNVTFKNLLYAGARECLTNLVKHAHGNRLVITVSEAEFYTRISFENNGEPPKGEIRYGGGLTSLSKICDRSRASMHVECDNVFRVVIEIPKLGGNA